MTRVRVRDFGFVVLFAGLALATREVRAQKFAEDASVIAEFNIPNDGDALCVPVMVNSNEHLFVIDTGCTRMVYDASFRAAFGPVRETEICHVPSGAIFVSLFDAPAARLGHLDLRGQVGSSTPLVACTDLSRIARSLGTDVRGIVGLSFLWRHIVRLDFDRGKLSFLSSAGPDAGVCLPLEPVDGDPMVRLDLPGLGETLFKIDTGLVGATGSLHTDVAQELRERGLASSIGSDLRSDAAQAWRTNTLRVASLRLGDFENTGLIFNEHAGNKPNRLGLAYLSRYVVTIDFPMRQIHFRPGRDFARRDRGGLSNGCRRFGIALIHEGGRTIVAAVAPGGPAAKAGIEAPCVIVAVDGASAVGARFLAVAKLLTDADSAIRLRIERDGVERDFDLRALPPLVLANRNDRERTRQANGTGEANEIGRTGLNTPDP